MPVEFVSSTQGSWSSATATLTVLVPTEVVAGDTMILFISLKSGYGVGTPPGWINVGTVNPSGRRGRRLQVFRRQAVAAPGTGGEPEQVTRNIPEDTVRGVIHVSRGADPDGPVVAVASDQSNVAPQMEAVADGGRLVVAHGSEPQGFWTGDPTERRVSGALRVADTPVSAGLTPAFTAQQMSEPIGGYVAFAILLAAGEQPPLAPVLVSPGDVEDLSDPVTIQHEFRDPNPGDTQAAKRVRRRSPGGDWFWWSGAEWQDTEQTLVSEDLTTETDAWGNGQTWEWTVATRDNTDLWGPYATPRSTEGSTRPTVDVMGPEDPVTDTSRPTVTWDWSDEQSAPQDTWEVRLFTTETADADGFTPEQSSGLVYAASGTGETGSHELPTLVNEESYRVYVRAAKANGLRSLWDSHDFTLDLVLPDPPGLTVEVDGPDVLLSVTTDGDRVEVTRMLPGAALDEQNPGEEVEVRGSPLLGSGTLTDRESPAGMQTWRARTVTDFEGVELVSEPAQVSAELSWQGSWLTDPLDPSAALELEGGAGKAGVAGDPSPTFDVPEGLGEHQGLGARHPTFTADAVRGVRISGRLVVKTQEQKEMFDRLRSTQRTLLLRNGEGDHWYVRLHADVPVGYLGVPGWRSVRAVGVTLVEQPRP